LTIWQQDRAIEVLNEHLDGDLALADLAKECALSAGRFMRAFKSAIVGTSPGRWRRANAPMPKAFNLPAPEEK
jgi:transcriptional regulator GlxA family with amidase domain